MKKRRKIVLLTGGLVLVLVAGVVGRMGLNWAAGVPNTITDVDEYSVVLNKWNGELTGHFPRSIPSSARDARMSFFPGFLQGGAHFQLCLTLPESEVQRVEAEWSAEATHRFQGGGGASGCRTPGDAPIPAFYTGETTDFPDSFTIYVLQAEDQGEEGHPWNHGRNAGLAISKETNQVVYWCESW